MSDNMDKTKAEEILGLTGQYTATDLRNAYAKCAKDYHPDAQGLNEAAKEIAQDYMTEINVAHTYLRKKFKEYPNIKTFTAGVEPGYTSSFDAAAASYSAAYNKKNNNNANNYNSTSTQQATTQNTNNTNNSYSASSFSQTNNYQTRDRQNQTYHQAQQDQTQRQSQTQSQTTTQNPNPADVEEAHDAATDAFRKAMFTYGSSVYIPPDPKNKKTNSDSVKADASNVSDPNSTYYGYSAASSASTAGTTQSTDSQTVSDVLQEPPKTRKGLIKSYHYAEKVIDHFPVSLILGIICLFITLTYWSGRSNRDALRKYKSNRSSTTRVGNRILLHVRCLLLSVLFLGNHTNRKNHSFLSC